MEHLGIEVRDEVLAETHPLQVACEPGQPHVREGPNADMDEFQVLRGVSGTAQAGAARCVPRYRLGNLQGNRPPLPPPQSRHLPAAPRRILRQPQGGRPWRCGPQIYSASRIRVSKRYSEFGTHVLGASAMTGLASASLTTSVDDCKLALM